MRPLYQATRGEMCSFTVVVKLIQCTVLSYPNVGQAEPGNQSILNSTFIMALPEVDYSGLMARLTESEDTAATLLFRENSELTAELCQYAQQLFLRLEGLGKLYKKEIDLKSGETLTGIDRLYIGKFEDGSLDAETLWAQIEMQNAVLFPKLRKTTKKLKKAMDEGRLKVLDISDSEEEEESEQEGSSKPEASNDSGVDDDEEEDHDSERQRMMERMARVEADLDDEESDSAGEDSHHSPNEDRKHSGALATAAEGTESSLPDPAAEELNNGFFDINEMEAFADEEEEYLPDSAFGAVKPEHGDFASRSFHQKQRDGDIDSATDDEEEDFLEARATTERRKRYREDDEVGALHRLYETPNGADDSDVDDVISMTAADLFGQPNKRYFGKWKLQNRVGSKDSVGRQDSWASEDDIDDPNEHVGWNDRNHGAAQESSDTSEDEEVPMKGSKDMQNKGTQSKLEKQIEDLEQQLVTEKPWQMTGETTSSSRPSNSLLETTPEFELATKMAPVITVTHTENLEELIKSRILAEDWDDVVPRELPDVGWRSKRGEAPEVSQEKSKLGLGELYEREYLQKTVGYDVDHEEKKSEEDRAKDEIRSLFANLCSKLDALSNYHFAPRPLEEEAEVRASNKPAIAMEEVLPLYTNAAQGSAPEEVFARKHGRAGVLRTDNEFEKTDRKRLRSAKKAARRKRRKAQLADEKLVSRLQPGNGLNNPYEKRKMREELASARSRGDVTEGTVDSNKYGSSGTFFQRLQEDARSAVQDRNQISTDNTSSNTKRKSSQTSSLIL